MRHANAKFHTQGRALSPYLTDPAPTIADIERAVMLSISHSVSPSNIGRRLHNAELHAQMIAALNTTSTLPKTSVVSRQTAVE